MAPISLRETYSRLYIQNLCILFVVIVATPIGFLLVVLICWKGNKIIEVIKWLCNRCRNLSGKPHPSGLKNNSTECYRNSVIQAVASSDKLIEQFTEIQLKYPNFESLNCFTELLQNVNTSDDSYEHLWKNTNLLERLIKLVHWTKLSQQDAFEFLSALVNGIHQDLESLNLVNFQYEIPMKYKMVYRYTGINIPNKIQNSLGLSLGLSGDYSTKPGVTIEYLIDKYFQPTIIDDDPNKTSQICLYRKAPDVLLLHIQANKWDNSRGEMIKPKYHIQYDQETMFCLNIVNELNEFKGIIVHYKIKAVVQHKGNIGGGHYVTYRNWNDQWFLVNDEHVELIKFDNDICPYILIYEKC